MRGFILFCFAFPQLTYDMAISLGMSFSGCGPCINAMACHKCFKFNLSSALVGEERALKKTPLFEFELPATFKKRSVGLDQNQKKPS
jgi:hypothetical protein